MSALALESECSAARQRHEHDAGRDRADAEHLAPPDALAEHPRAGDEQDDQADRVRGLHDRQRRERQRERLQRHGERREREPREPAPAPRELAQQRQAHAVLAADGARLARLHDDREVEARGGRRGERDA